MELEAECGRLRKRLEIREKVQEVAGMNQPIPDNHDAFRAHDDAQERRLEGLPICADCEEPIQEEYFYTFAGKNYCAACTELLHIRFSS